MNKIDLRRIADGSNGLLKEVAAEALRLHVAIETHQSKKGHELCWINDVELWNTINPQSEYPFNTLPIKEEFLAQCGRYYESRLVGSDYVEPATHQSVNSNKFKK